MRYLRCGAASRGWRVAVDNANARTARVRCRICAAYPSAQPVCCSSHVASTHRGAPQLTGSHSARPVQDNRQLLDDMHAQPVSRRQYLWSCLCGLMSIKVTESSGAGVHPRSYRMKEEETPLQRNQEASPEGPEEVEATCIGYKTSMPTCPKRSLQKLAECSIMKWSCDAIVTDTTINLALTCILMRISHATGCVSPPRTVVLNPKP